MPETKIHEKLKKLGKEFLKSQGATKIEEEYKCVINGKHYVVDVVGFSPEMKIAIECGSSSWKKLQALKTYFDKVIVLTVESLIDHLESRLQYLEKKISELGLYLPPGTIVGVRQVQNRGRVQIPKKIREALELNDGDMVYWVRSPDGKFYITKAAEIG